MALEAHSRFFDHLVELVPAKYYLAGEQEPLNLKYMKKSARDEAKAAFKQQYKQNKRAKLDPGRAKTTLELQREQQQQQQQRQQANGQDGAAESDSSGEEGGGDTGAAKTSAEAGRPAAVAGKAPSATQLALPSGKPLSREELKEKLHKKLELFRQQRKAEEQHEKAEEAKQWREKKLDKGRKAAQDKQKLRAAKDTKQLGQGQQPPQQQGRQVGKQPGGQQQLQQQDRKRQRAEGGLHFSKVDFGTGDKNMGPRSKKHKPTKAELLRSAEARQSQAQELGGTAEGKTVLAKEAWGAALARASGDRVLDDPKLLRKSLKKETKLKAKKAQAWQERLGKQKEQQEARQQKRKDNIEGRIKARQDRRKASREKKLLRAGFEGRKEGFIATPKAG
ncbi:hypothetical protein N2152v2_005139 [Parachlorella kessleri]